MINHSSNAEESCTDSFEASTSTYLGIHPTTQHNTVVKQKSPYELVQEFWNAHPDALFGQIVVAHVRNVSVSTIQNERWYGKGIRFRKISGRVLYRKADVIAYLESHEPVNSTSEYKQTIEESMTSKEI